MRIKEGLLGIVLTTIGICQPAYSQSLEDEAKEAITKRLETKTFQYSGRTIEAELAGGNEDFRIWGNDIPSEQIGFVYLTARNALNSLPGELKDNIGEVNLILCELDGKYQENAALTNHKGDIFLNETILPRLSLTDLMNSNNFRIFYEARIVHELVHSLICKKVDDSASLEENRAAAELTGYLSYASHLFKNSDRLSSTIEDYLKDFKAVRCRTYGGIDENINKLRKWFEGDESFEGMGDFMETFALYACLELRKTVDDPSLNLVERLLTNLVNGFGNQADNYTLWNNAWKKTFEEYRIENSVKLEELIDNFANFLKNP